MGIADGGAPGSQYSTRFRRPGQAARDLARHGGCPSRRPVPTIQSVRTELGFGPVFHGGYVDGYRAMGLTKGHTIGLCHINFAAVNLDGKDL